MSINTTTAVNIGTDEISTTVPSSTAVVSTSSSEQNAYTSYILLIFPFYLGAIIVNFLSIYSILMARIYRQYLSHILFTVISIGALIYLHGYMFLVLLRWANSSSTSNQLCSSSTYLRDNGSILIYTHILLLASERILANLKKHPQNLNNGILQKAHLLLIIISFISIILAFTIPINTLKASTFSITNGLCVPKNSVSYRKYFHWIYFGFGYPFVWSSILALGLFLLRKTTISYTTLIPMNRIILTVCVSASINLLIQTIFDDFRFIGDNDWTRANINITDKMYLLMNLRDFISLIDKLLIGLLFFIFRPEIRLWLYESMQRFQTKKTDTMVPQMLDIRSEIDDNFRETDDGNSNYPANM